MQPDPLSTYGRQALDEDDILAVTEALRGQYLTGGPAVRAFESALEAFTGGAHAVSCGNCTQALHLAAKALGAGPGRSVIVPAVTFLSTANMPRALGADVVFADINPESGLMGPEHLRAALERCASPPVAVMPVHLGGQVCDMPGIHDIARKAGLKIIEDGAHAIGSSCGANGSPHRVGDSTFSDATTFSFHPVKNITTGEGGAVLTGDSVLADKMRKLRAHGVTRNHADFTGGTQALDEGGAINPWYYEMQDLGFNYRMTDIAAALGVSQLRKLPGFVAHRARLKARYDALLTPYAKIIRPVKAVTGCAPAWHIYAVLVDFEAAGISRAALMRALGEKGVASQVHYIPVYRQPYYRRIDPDFSLPGAETYYARTLTLPLHVHMEESHVERAVQTLAEILGL